MLELLSALWVGGGYKNLGVCVSDCPLQMNQRNGVNLLRAGTALGSEDSQVMTAQPGAPETQGDSRDLVGDRVRGPGGEGGLDRPVRGAMEGGTDLRVGRPGGRWEQTLPAPGVAGAKAFQ